MVRFRLGDITQFPVDAIVNAANQRLSDGAGVNGAIHRGAGPGLSAACRAVAPCPTGQARITPGFNLPVRFIIHTVGPVWHGGEHSEAELLASAHRSCIDLADAHGLSSLAFPAISCGIFGYPITQAAQIAVETVLEQMPGTSVGEATFVLFSPDLLETFESVVRS